MESEEFEGHNPICHTVERRMLLGYLEGILVVRLDGDPRLIESILDAMEDVPEAA